MKKNILRTICLLLSFLYFAGFAMPISALDYSGLPNTSKAKCVYFYNTNTKSIIFKKGGGQQIAPASSTKIMTGLLACELLCDRLDETVTVTSEMIRPTEGTRMKLGEGDKLSIRSLIYGTVCGGFNDAAYALAYVAAQGHTEFVKLMNEKASALGATNTNYLNPTGFDTAGQYTTLEDVAIIAKAALKNELYMEISSTSSKNVRFLNDKADFTIHNRNGLIDSYYAQGYKNNHAAGLIAGVTDLGGYTVITSAGINDSNYLCIVMGGTEENGTISAYTIANELIYYAKNNLLERCLMKKDALVCTVPIEFALDGAATKDEEDYLNVRTASDVTAILPQNADTSKITYKYHLYSDTLNAPVVKETVVGVIDFYIDGEYLVSAPLCVNADVSANTFLVKMDNVKSAMTSRITIIPIILFLVFSSTFLLYKSRRKRKIVHEIRMKRYEKAQSSSNNFKI